jgi:hypothetical protein
VGFPRRLGLEGALSGLWMATVVFAMTLVVSRL